MPTIGQKPSPNPFEDSNVGATPVKKSEGGGNQEKDAGASKVAEAAAKLRLANLGTPPGTPIEVIPVKTPIAPPAASQENRAPNVDMQKVKGSEEVVKELSEIYSMEEMAEALTELSKVDFKNIDEVHYKIYYQAKMQWEENLAASDSSGDNMDTEFNRAKAAFFDQSMQIIEKKLNQKLAAAGETKQFNPDDVIYPV